MNYMTTKTHDLVLEFHKTYDCVVRTSPQIDVPEKELRVELIREEFEELKQALKDNDLVEIADALGDLEYVIEGAAITFGLELNNISPEPGHASVELIEEGLELLKVAVSNNNSSEVLVALIWLQTTVRNLAEFLEIPLDDIIQVIHDSNMSKLGEDGQPIYRESDRKVLKGPNFFTPTEKIKEILLPNV